MDAGAPPTAPLDEAARRAQLLELGERLFTTHAYADLSMSRIAREAGISKALLYHYFPSKLAFFEATLHSAAAELRELTAPDLDLPPAQRLDHSLDAFLRWVDEHPRSYEALLRTAQQVDEVRALVDGARDLLARRLLDGILPIDQPRTPATRTTVRAWMWFVDGACLEWIRHRDLERAQLRRILLVTLLNSLRVAGEVGSNAARGAGR